MNSDPSASETNIFIATLPFWKSDKCNYFLVSSVWEVTSCLSWEQLEMLNLKQKVKSSECEKRALFQRFPTINNYSTNRLLILFTSPFCVWITHERIPMPYTFSIGPSHNQIFKKYFHQTVYLLFYIFLSHPKFHSHQSFEIWI